MLGFVSFLSVTGSVLRFYVSFCEKLRLTSLSGKSLESNSPLNPALRHPGRHKNFPDPETKVQFQQLKCSDSLYQQIVKERLLNNPVDIRFWEFSNVT